MEITTIKLTKKTKKSLDLFKEYKNETYDEVVTKLLYIAKNPELSEEIILAIQKARKRIQNGMYVSEEDAMKRLGL